MLSFELNCIHYTCTCVQYGDVQQYPEVSTLRVSSTRKSLDNFGLAQRISIEGERGSAERERAKVEKDRVLSSMAKTARGYSSVKRHLCQTCLRPIDTWSFVQLQMLTQARRDGTYRQINIQLEGIWLECSGNLSGEKIPVTML